MPERESNVVQLFSPAEPEVSDQDKLVKLMDELALMARAGQMTALSFAAVVQRDEPVCWSGQIGTVPGVDLEAVRCSGAEG